MQQVLLRIWICAHYWGKSMLLSVYRRVFLLCLWVLLAGCQSLPSLKQIPFEDAPHNIHFIYEGWHTSILLEVKSVVPYSRYLQADLAGQQYVRIGWGDGDYFTGKRKTAGAATKALFVSGYSAVQVLTYVQKPFDHIPAETRVPLALTDKGMKRLVRYLENSLALDKKGYPVPLPSYVENAGNFYLAQHHYSVFSNCNTWSSGALQRAGLPVRSRLHLTPQSVFDQARLISGLQRQRGLFASNSF
jgi:uncharacterized protein (TIGR02117 family)